MIIHAHALIYQMCCKSVNIIYKMKEVNNLIPLCTIGKVILKTQFLVLVSNLKTGRK